MIKQVRVYVKGDVIGVGFRAWTAIQAKKLGVKGWVRNIFDKPEIFGVDGGVEALIQAEENALQKMISILKKGPAFTRIDEVEEVYENLENSFADFEILG